VTDAAALLRTEHAVARVLVEAPDEPGAYEPLLAAIGESLGCEAGAFLIAEAGGLRCAETWHGPGLFRHGTADLRSTLCVPVRGAGGALGAIELLSRERYEADEALLATLTSLGDRIGQRIDAWRAELALHESDAHKSAILNAAFDCIITMNAEGLVVEVNEATERTFGYSADEMVGRELAELIVPPSLRAAHRHGVERYVATGQGQLVGHPVELPAMRADGSEFPAEMAITRPVLPGPPQFTGYIRDVTGRKRDEEAVRSLAKEQAALRRVATTVARTVDQERVFAVVTEEVGRLLGANTANLIRFEPGDRGFVVGAWSLPKELALPVGTQVTFEGATVTAKILRSGRPERVDSYDDITGAAAELARTLGLRATVGAPIELAGRLWGAVTVSTVEETSFPPGSEQRLADFAELVSVALANAAAREELAASRARIVEAGDAARRRIERNLHDGAQQRLVALSLTLRLAERRLAEAGPDALELVHAASLELADALEELRELARGIHPAILTDRGLGPALEMLAGRASIPVEVSAPVDDELPSAVEAAAYYMVSEALTNASKHAGASRLRVEVAHVNGHARIEVADDGVGGADPQKGSGLRGLLDRVEALGGRLEVESPPGGGTTLMAWIPCRSVAASSGSPPA
jgi:PAS domain S-box-containing protein